VSDPDDRGPERQLAADLSGRYGPYFVHLTSFDVRYSEKVRLFGHIYNDDGAEIGRVERSFGRENGFLVADHDLLELDRQAQGQGFSTAFYDELEDYYRRSDVDLIRIHAALGVGGYAWARRGFDWDPHRIAASFDNLRTRINALLGHAGVSDGDKNILRSIRDRLDVNDVAAGWPAPRDLALLAGDSPDLGRKLLIGSNWYGVYPLTEKGGGYGG
jgi:GNAT superfamily N-acetyltransferase